MTNDSGRERAGDFFSTVMDRLDDAVVVTDADDRIAYSNPAMSSLCAMAAADLHGAAIAAAFKAGPLAPLLDNYAMTVQNGAPVAFEFQTMHDTRPRHIDGECAPRDGGEGVICILRDRTRLRQAEIDLEQARHYARTISDNAPIGLYIFDCNAMRVEYGNPAYFDMLEYSLEEIQAAGVGIVDKIYHPDDYARLKEHDRKLFASKDGEVQAYEARIIGKSGKVSWALAREMVLCRNADGSPAKTLCAFTDITEHRKTEEALHRAQKLESLGTLAAGIAHDFNNLLGGIYGFAYLASAKSNDPAVRADLKASLETIDRARSLTGQLLTFARGGEPVRAIADPAPVVRQTAEFALSGSSVVCDYRLAADVWPCDFDKNQISQVIENIVLNARQAMADQGRLTVSAYNQTIETHEYLPPGPYVAIAIGDTGPGIPGDLHGRVFDPFYTTKPSGHGLGLSASHSIVKRHGGAIELESKSGEGALFRIYLPASPGAAIPAAAVEENAHYGAGTILVMDDEPVMRAVLRDMLGMLGYTPVCTNEGQSAADYFIEDHAGKRRVVAAILDLTVREGLGGVEAAEKIRAVDPDIPIFMASGYADHPIMAHPGEYGFTASIRKPFRIEEMRNLLTRHIPKSRGDDGHD
jgi:PAS domain S-box-containing protein